MARELQAREKEKKEQELRELAMRARAERGGAGSYAPPPAAARCETSPVVAVCCSALCQSAMLSCATA